MAPINILIATPNRRDADRLRAILGAARLRVIGQARNLMELYSTAEEEVPDLVLVDSELTIIPEFEVILALFAALDIRWLMLCGGEGGAPPRRVRGLPPASDLFPVDLSRDTAHLLRQLRALTYSVRKGMPAKDAPAAPPKAGGEEDRLVLIGASTGGIEALMTVLSGYPARCPPTMIVQHTGPGFGAGLVRLLDRVCPARISACEDGMIMTPGLVCIAAGMAAHLEVTGHGPFRARLIKGQPVSGHMPSVDVLFRSAAPVARRIVGVLLTGMGKDGAAGLLELRRNGAATIVQDRASSAVYGMPRVASEMGAAQQEIPLPRISDAILRACALPPVPPPS